VKPAHADAKQHGFAASILDYKFIH